MEMFKEEGLTEGRLKTLFDFVNDGMIDIKDAAKRANLTEAEFLARTKSFEK